LALFINKDRNTMIFNDEDFENNRNYIPDLFLGLNELDKNRDIHIAIDLEKTPIVFILFFRKILSGSQTPIYIYYKEDNDIFKAALTNYGLTYRNINDFPE